ncbi:hypothetical protein [uncultured Agathobaculum sp.]|uniref:hypothetical protein n=1 Tax=uncultured Agathobaculum sp. TaxID=2048140 RepID=UPI00320A7D0D
MFCWKCGREVCPGSKFCEYCGSILDQDQKDNAAETQPKKERHHKKGIAYVIVAFLVIAMGVGGFWGIKYLLNNQNQDANVISSFQDEGFNTPEELAAAFTTAIQTQNFEKALTYFDIVNASQSNVAISIERSGIYSAINASTWGMLPTEHESYESYIPLNMVGRLACGQREMISFLFDLLMGDSNFAELRDIADSKIAAMSTSDNPSGAATYADLFTALDPSQLSTLNFVELIYVNPEIQDDEHNQQNIAKQCEQYMCDDIADYYIIYTLNDQYYCGSMRLHHYDDGWKIFSLSAALSGMGSGEAIPISRQEYMNLVQTHKLEQ